VSYDTGLAQRMPSGAGCPATALRLTDDSTSDGPQVSHDVGFSVSVIAYRPVELVIYVSSVATQLLARLKQRPDAEYAQRDLVMRPLRGIGAIP